ncbi:MAG: dockerin type I repeat-containing protein [Oscillospiraceae bacterium]|nr:dockerin type I repeat-containing protein [Oscillospiraceae bacterium]
MFRKITGIAAAAAVLLGTLPLQAISAAPEEGLLDVSGFRIMDENLVYIGADYLTDCTVLFDDQDKVPASPDNASVSSEVWEATSRKNWKPNWQAEFGEDSFLIDMGANYVVTGICFLDTNDIKTWKVEDGEPFGWNEITSFDTDWYNSWRGLRFEDPRETRYLRFSSSSGETGVAELAIYGYKVSDLTDAQKKKTAARGTGSAPCTLTAGQKIGFNAFIDDPMTAIMAGGNVREYHNFNWLIDETGRVRFTQGTWGDMDSYYAAMKAQNISIIPCFQGGSASVSGDSAPEICVPAGADTLDPASYAVHARALYQVAARYGSNPDVDPATINITDAQEVKIGMGLLEAAENSNEPNKTWSGKANYFTPYELAAMCSADYDGHEGTIPNAGVKQADPNFKLAMGGMLSTASLIEYLDEMKMWFDYNRTDGVFAVDIINVHLGPGSGIPEEGSYLAYIRKLQDWIDKNAPGAELWISEFEIPMSDCETEGVDNHDNELYQLRYAQRVARTYLACIGAGVDRITKFQLRDEGEGVYYNSGLVTGKGEWSKKLAWYYVACMTDVLENCDLTEDRSADSVCDYVFTDRQTGETVHCLWLPTAEGKEIADYKLSADGAGFASLTVPGTYAEGVTSALTVQKDSVTLDVSETPVFVRFSGSAPGIVNGRGRYITPEALCLSEDRSTELCDLSAAPADTKLGQFYRMFDEKDTMPEYIYSDTAGLETPSTNVNQSGITCYVDLDGSYVLTGFGVYDTYGTGSIEVYDAHTDVLLWSSDLGGYMSRSMTLTADSLPTDRLKIVKGGGDLNELALYGYPLPECAFDVTLDGSFTLLDVIALQRYLVRERTALPAWRAGDSDGDGTLTVLDLSQMKQALLKA